MKEYLKVHLDYISGDQNRFNAKKNKSARSNQALDS